MALFAAPLLAAALVLEFVFLRTGESWPVGSAEAHQAALPVSLYGRQFFSQQYNLYKNAGLRRRSPAIVVLGSSRVMQFRDFLFHPLESAFYNAGGLIQTEMDVTQYAEAVRSGALPRPRTLVLGIDPWWLKPGPVAAPWVAEGASDDAVFRFGEHVQVARAILKDRLFPWRAALTGTLTRTPAYAFPAFGLAALRHGYGERKDGSHLGEEAILDFLRHPVYRDREQPPVIQRVRESSLQFTPAPALDPARVDALFESLERLRADGVEVLTFEPPFSTEVLAALDQSQAGWWIEYRDRLKARLQASGFVCLPVGAPNDYGLDDTYMLDGFHPSEVLESYLLERLVRAAGPGSLLTRVDLGYIRALRARPGVLPVAFELPGRSNPAPN